MKEVGFTKFFFFEKSKKGLAPIITNVLLISLAIVAVAIVWVILSGILQSSKEDVDFEKSKIDLKIKNVYINDSLISVKINRRTGIGNMGGIRFVFLDGQSSEHVDNVTSLEELEERTFYMSLSKLNVFSLQTVSIAPLILLSSGELRVGNIVDSFEIGPGNYNSSFGSYTPCINDTDCPPDLEGSSQCNTSTGNIETLWTVYECSEFGRCESYEETRLSSICTGDGCYTFNATCVGVSECSQAIDCGSDGFIGLPYCGSFGNLYQNYINYYCNLGICSNVIGQLEIQSCEGKGCIDDPEEGSSCVPGMVCTDDSVCGEDGIILGSEYCCCDEEVWIENIDYFCEIEDGEEEGVCSNTITVGPKEGGNCSAMEGNWICSQGECLEQVECTNDEHCNPEGTCGKICINNTCVIEEALLSGTVYSIWPSDLGEYFDSSELPTSGTCSPESGEVCLLTTFVKFTSGEEGRCLQIREFVLPLEPDGRSYIRFDVQQSAVSPGDTYEIWKTKINCECT